MSYIVEGVSWELRSRVMRSGLSAHSYMLGISDAIDRSLFPPSTLPALGFPESEFPSQVIHPAVVVYGYVYEFSDDGVKKTVANKGRDPGSTCEVYELVTREELGKTTISLREFDRWIARQMQGQFRKGTYCVSKNNCCHFAIEAAKFLGVVPLYEWERMVRYTENNPIKCKLAKYIGGSSGSSSGSSSSSSGSSTSSSSNSSSSVRLPQSSIGGLWGTGFGKDFFR